MRDGLSDIKYANGDHHDISFSSVLMLTSIMRLAFCFMCTNFSKVGFFLEFTMVSVGSILTLSVTTMWLRSSILASIPVFSLLETDSESLIADGGVNADGRDPIY